MPLRLDVRKKLSSRSDRVKSVDLHPTEDWMLASLYNGNVHIWNFETQQIAKTFEVCDLPVRAAKFVARKHWVITGSDDMKVRVFNYNTLERVHQFDAHADYIRSIAVHPSNSFLLTSSDDMSIKLWDWDKKWTCTQVFEGHTHYVMQVVFNPKDNNSFVSASLDRTLKVWQLGSSAPNFTLEGHEKGVNCVAYYAGGDKPYLISGADDRNVKIWDYQNKACVQTLQGHAHNIAAVAFHPELPIILSGSEDGTFRIWHANTYRLESTLNYGMERGWSLAVQKGSNHVALGYDEGCVLIQLGREEPAMSMDSMGKILWAKHAEIQQANIKSLSSETEVKDGEVLPLDFKDLGSSDLYPQSVRHNSNGRFVVVCGDGEYCVYTAMALRNKCFGPALEFVWSAHDGNEYALRENNSQVRIFKNFKEKTSFKPDFGVEGIYGGHLLGVKSTTGLAFYDWETAKIIRRIEISSKNVLWNESGTLVCIATDENFFILKYDAEAASKGSRIDEDGIEEAFDVVGEVAEVMRTGVWVGDCFIYTNSMNRLNYFVGGEIVTVSHLDKVCYILGYLPKENRIFLGDKEMNVISYSLLLSVMEYQTCVMRQDFTAADQILPTIPKEHRNRVAHFLEKQGFKAQALAVTTDPEHQFDLALHLGDLKTAVDVASNPAVSTEQKWKQLAEVATRQCDFALAQRCLHQAEDFGGLLLMASAAGNSTMVETLGSSAKESGKNNIAFISYFILGKLEECLEVLVQSHRLAEAAFFARTYLPSHISRVVTLWKESVAKKNSKAAGAIADPTDYENLFPGLRQCFQAENYLRTERNSSIPALAYPSLTANDGRDIEAEVAASLAAGADLDSVVHSPPEAGLEEAERVVGASHPPAAAAVVEGEAIVASTSSSTAAASPSPPPPPVVDDLAGELERIVAMAGPAEAAARPSPPYPSSAVWPAIAEQPVVSGEELVDVCHTLAAQKLDDEKVAVEEEEEVMEEAREDVCLTDLMGKEEEKTPDDAAEPPKEVTPSPLPVVEQTPEPAKPVPSFLESLLPSTADIATPNSAAFSVSTPAFFQSFVSAPLGDLIGSLSGASTPRSTATPPPTVDESVVKEKSPTPVDVKEKSPSPVEAKAKSLSPVQVMEKSPSPVEEKEKSPSPVGVKEKSSSPMAVKEKSPSPMAVKEKSPSPMAVKEKSPSPTAVKEKSPSPVEMKEKSLSPVEVKEKSPSPVEVKEKSPSSVEVKEKSPSPIEVKEKSPSPVEVKEKSPSPVEVKEKSPSLVEVKEKSPSPVEMKEKSPSPVEVKEKSPSPVEVKEKSPSPVEVKEKSPTPETIVADRVVDAASSNICDTIPDITAITTTTDTAAAAVVSDAALRPVSSSLLPDLLTMDGNAAPSSIPVAPASSLFPSMDSSPFNDLFNAAIETLKTEPEAKLDQLDPLMDDHDEEAGAADKFEANAAAADSTPDVVMEAAALVDFDAPLVPVATSSSAASIAANFAAESPVDLLITPAAPAADPFGAWDESDPVAEAIDGEAASADAAAPAMVVEKEASPVVVDAAAAAGNDAEAAGETLGVDDEFGDDWGDDAWGEDFEEGKDEEEEEAASSTAPVKMRSAAVAATLDVDAMLEAELDLDLDDINLDNVDTSDLNLSDDMLSD